VVLRSTKPNGPHFEKERTPAPSTLAAMSLAADALLTVEEVAEILRVPASWVYGRTRLRSRDRIPGFRLGKYWRFRETDVRAWIEKRRAGVGANA
jgi:excisionase family DNA binding protein